MSERNIILVGMVSITFLICASLILISSKTNGFIKSSKFDNWKWKDNWTSELDSYVPKKKEHIDLSPEIKQEKKPEIKEKIAIEATSFPDALSKSKESGKNILIFFYTDYCTYCDEFKAETLSKSDVKEKMKDYVVYYCNAIQERDVSSKYKVTKVPAYKILDSNGEVVKSGSGKLSPNDFIGWMN